jgi:hypothetical protein
MLNGKVVVVTGAARGIGRQYVLDVVEQGGLAVAADRASCEETLAALGTRRDRAIGVTVDVADRASVDAMAAAASKAVKYPVSMLVVFAAMLTGFSLHIVPILTTMLPPEKWPLLGRILYTISQLITNYGFYSVLTLAAAIAAFIYSLPRWHGRGRQIVDKFLPYRFYRDYYGAMLVVSLSMLLRSGVSLRSSLDRSLAFSTPWMRFHIRRILKTLANANTPNFGEAFKTGVLNQYLEDRVQDASERRNPTEAFVRIGVGSIDRVIAEIHKSAAGMSSAIMIVCGIVLFIMMGGFFSTTMELQSGIKASAQGNR